MKNKFILYCPVCEKDYDFSVQWGICPHPSRAKPAKVRTGASASGVVESGSGEPSSRRPMVPKTKCKP